ncbi:hypothetical protein CMK18_08100 [Candidatus Poribacteria bacterium]|nr:hypothetical protein [Candidatus Poribacteria bacterium]
MLSRFYVIFCAFFFLLITISESELLMFDDFEEAKINRNNWTHGVQANKISWKTKNGHLEILPIGGGAGGAAAFGYGLVEFEKFGLQFDFQPLHDDFGNGSWTGILFRASQDFKFYQLYITPEDGIGTKNYARWYIRNGEENTWKELRDLRTKLPFSLISKQWYTLTLTGKNFKFELYLKKKEDPISQKVMDWTDAKSVHRKGTIGFIADNSRHYYIDNLRLFDRPDEVNLSIEPIDRITTFWGKLKGDN